MYPWLAEFLAFWWPALALAMLGVVLKSGDDLKKWASDNNASKWSPAANKVAVVLQQLSKLGFYALVAAFLFTQCATKNTSHYEDDAQECERLPSIYGC